MTVVSHSLRMHGDGHLRFSNAIETLGNSETMERTVYRRALNHIGAKAKTEVVRAVTKQIGLKRAQVIRFGGIDAKRADYRHLDYRITSTGGDIPLREFSAKQFSYGVRARPWGKSTRFPGLFINAGTWRSGRAVASGHVFQRTTAASTPIEKQFGPNVPTEIVKGASAEAFNRLADELPARVAHELTQATRGAVT